jgi:ABC-type lipopolysaccharide export system ATPase subunit
LRKLIFIAARCANKGIIITDHNYENVIAIATKNNIDERWQSTSFK